jgi:hypothetical protein
MGTSAHAPLGKLPMGRAQGHAVTLQNCEMPTPLWKKIRRGEFSESAENLTLEAETPALRGRGFRG